MKVSGLLFIVSVSLSTALKLTDAQTTDISTDAQRPGSRVCSNLTLVLDNWKFAIQSQVKDLLLHDHHTVLPDYRRIQLLSDAMDDLYREFTALKERLAELTARFDGVESFADGMRSGRKPAAPPRRDPRPPGPPPPGETGPAGGRPLGRRSRVVVRRVLRPVAAHN